MAPNRLEHRAFWGGMTHYYLHLRNSVGFVRDQEGKELTGLAEAREAALTAIRGIVGEEAKAGRIDLAGRIDIADEADQTLMSVRFAEAFDLHLDGMS